MTYEAPFEVLVLGPGALGLGLLGALTASAATPLSLAGREGAKPRIFKSLCDHRRFNVIEPGRPSAPIEFASFYRMDTMGGRNKLLRHLVNTPNLLVFSAIRGGQSDVARLVTEALKQRRNARRTGTLMLAPCENDVAPALASLRFYAGSDFVYIDTVPDRICHEPIVGRKGYVEVRVAAEVEVFGSLHLGGNRQPAGAQATDLLQRLGFILLDEERLAVMRTSKLLLLNGVHTAIALLSLEAKRLIIGDYLATEAGAKELEALSVEFALDLSSRQPDRAEQEIQASRIWYRDRIAREQDEVKRILSRLGSATTGSFLADTARKLGDTRDALVRIYRNEEKANRSSVNRALLYMLKVTSKLMEPGT